MKAHNPFVVLKSILKSPNPDDFDLIKKIPKRILDIGIEQDCVKWLEEYKEKHKGNPTYETVENKFPDVFALTKINPSVQPSYYLQEFLETRKQNHIRNTLDTAMEGWDASGVPPNFQNLFKETQEIVSFGLTDVKTNKNVSLGKLLPSKGTFKTGMKGFDDAVGGLSGGEVTAFVARPNIAKTSFLSWLAGYVWYNRKNKVLFVTCEQTSQSIMQRFVALNGDFNPNVFRNYDDPLKVTTAQQQIAQMTIENLNNETEKTFVVPDKLVSSVSEIAGLLAEDEYDIVIIDAFYKLDAGLNDGDDTANVQKIIRAITSLAINYDIPIIISSQLVKNAKEGTMDMRDIGFTVAISQECAFIFFIDRSDDVTQRTVSMTKTRAGGDGLIMNFEFDLNNLHFKELED